MKFEYAKEGSRIQSRTLSQEKESGSVCGVCCQAVTSGKDEALFCEGACKRLMHRFCGMPLCTEKHACAAMYILTPNTHICIREAFSQKLGRGLESGNDAKYRQVHPRLLFKLSMHHADHLTTHVQWCFPALEEVGQS